MCLAVPGKVLSVFGKDQLSKKGRIDFDGVQKEVSLAYVPQVRVGQYVMVHVGFALSIVDEAQAKEVFAYLKLIRETGADPEAGEPKA